MSLVIHIWHEWRYTTTHCNILKSTATHWNAPQHTMTHCDTLQHTATHCTTPNILQHTLQHTATYCLPGYLSRQRQLIDDHESTAVVFARTPLQNHDDLARLPFFDLIWIEIVRRSHLKIMIWTRGKIEYSLFILWYTHMSGKRWWSCQTTFPVEDHQSTAVGFARTPLPNHRFQNL